MKEFLAEHKELAEAIASGDADRARKCAEDHIRAAWQSIITVFEKENR